MPQIIVEQPHHGDWMHLPDRIGGAYPKYGPEPPPTGPWPDWWPDARSWLLSLIGA